MIHSTALPKKILASVLLIALLFTAAGFFHYKDSFIYRRSPSRLSPGQKGVIFYDRWRALDGYNILSVSVINPESLVFDMKGDEVFRFPGGWNRFLRDGSFFSASTEIYFFAIDGRLLWQRPLGPHHDLDLSADEKYIFFIADKIQSVEGHKTAVENIFGYTTDGTEIFRWQSKEITTYLKSLLPVAPLYYSKQENHYSMTHLNSVQVLPPNQAEKTIPAFRAGNILVNCFRYALVFILDRQTHKIVWSHRFSTHEWWGAHSVKLDPSGHLFYFFNRNSPDKKNPHSSVAEYDPIKDSVVWEYAGVPKDDFSIEAHGSALRLQNGNILITHNTTGGSAFEITPQGRLVWEWVNPEVNTAGIPMPIYRVERWPRDQVDQILKVWKAF